MHGTLDMNERIRAQLNCLMDGVGPGEDATPEMLELKGVVKRYGGVHCRERFRSDGPSRGDFRISRAKRRGQDHDDSHDRRSAGADRRVDHDRGVRSGGPPRPREGARRVHPGPTVSVREAFGQRVPTLCRRSLG